MLEDGYEQNNHKLLLLLAAALLTRLVLFKALLMKGDDFPIAEIRLYDIDKERQDNVAVLVDYVVKTHAPHVNLTVTTEPEVAFSDADFVFAQIRVGQYKNA